MRENNCFAIGVGRNDSVSSHICPKSGQTRCRHRNKRTKKNPRYPARELKYFWDTDTRACKPSNHFTMTGHFLFWIVIEWKELTFFLFPNPIQYVCVLGARKQSISLVKNFLKKFFFQIFKPKTNGHNTQTLCKVGHFHFNCSLVSKNICPLVNERYFGLWNGKQLFFFFLEIYGSNNRNLN